MTAGIARHNDIRIAYEVEGPAGMGHDLPGALQPAIAAEITALAGR